MKPCERRLMRCSAENCGLLTMAMSNNDDAETTYETQSTCCPHVWEPRAPINSGERRRHCAFRPTGGAAFSTGFHSPPARSHRVERREATGDSVPSGESEGTLSRT